MADDSESVDIQAAAGPAEPTPGKRLQEARESRELTVAEVARSLRLDTWMVEALERDDYESLGAPVFAKGHMRKYAQLLDIEPDSLMVAYYQAAGHPVSPPLINEAMLTTDVTRRRGRMLPALVTLLIAAILIGLVVWWYLLPGEVPESVSAAGTTGSVSRAEPAQGAGPDTGATTGIEVILPGPAPASRPGPEPEFAADPATGSENAVPATPTAASGSGSGVIDAAAGSADALPGNVTEAATQAGGQEPDDARTGAIGTVPQADPASRVTESGDLRVTLTFRDESWVEVYDANRRKLAYGLGNAGTTRSLSGPGPLQVFLGRASDVTVTLNGEPFEIPDSARRGNTARFRIGASGRKIP